MNIDRRTKVFASNQPWSRQLDYLYYAFQPIVNIHTGVCFGFEALLRGWDSAGFSSIFEFLNTSYEKGYLQQIDMELRRKALSEFTSIPFFDTIKLFYNLDNRLLDNKEYSTKYTVTLLEEFDLPADNFFFEISERHEIDGFSTSKLILEHYKQQHFRIAIDDFGSGYAGLQLLYHSEPDLIKIDRFFIDGIDSDERKRLFISNIVNMAHIMGITVIAEGVETANEFYTCRNIGCDLVQGYLIQRPTDNRFLLKSKYDIVSNLVKRDKRHRESSEDLIQRKMEIWETIPVNSPTIEVLEKFRKNKNLSFFPVVNEKNEPIGILREKELKSYVYNPYGISLLMNQAYRKDIFNFISKPPVAEIHSRVEKIIELYAIDPEAEAVIITENGKYKGILSSKALLQIVSEREIAEARDQNPLTKLSGNTLINEYISNSLEHERGEMVFVYFDFNNFKPFNDNYGFRNGDRAILLFGDMLKELSHREDVFTGHIGGDDFFLGMNTEKHDFTYILNIVKELVSAFEENVKSFYNKTDQENAYLISKDRNGRSKKFPLLSVSAAVLCISPRQDKYSIDRLSTRIAELKTKSKRAADRIAVSSL
jgi:diguanylate cyclase (GGDEF)-like protein